MTLIENIFFFVFFITKTLTFCQIFHALRLLNWALRLFFLLNFSGPTFILYPTSNLESRVNCELNINKTEKAFNPIGCAINDKIGRRKQMIGQITGL